MNQELSLNYRMFGNGHPVVFLHGFLESISMWDTLKLETLPFQSILIDLPGHGKSALMDNADSPSIDFIAEQVEKVIRNLKIQRYHVVGHSMGGYVALILKEKDPKCDKVVLLNSNFWEDPATKKRDRVRVADIALKAKEIFINEAIPGLFYRHEKNEPFVQELIAETKNMNGESIAYSSLAMRNRSNKRSLIIDNPKDFLIIQGRFDPLISPEKMKEELSSEVVQTIVFENSGHMTHFEESEKLNEELSNFFAKKTETLVSVIVEDPT